MTWQLSFSLYTKFFGMYHVLTYMQSTKLLAHAFHHRRRSANEKVPLYYIPASTSNCISCKPALGLGIPGNNPEIRVSQSDSLKILQIYRIIKRSDTIIKINVEQRVSNIMSHAQKWRNPDS